MWGSDGGMVLGGIMDRKVVLLGGVGFDALSRKGRACELDGCLSLDRSFGKCTRARRGLHLTR